MYAFRTAIGAALGLAALVGILSEVGSAPGTAAQALARAAGSAFQPQSRIAEVTVAFDQDGLPLSSALLRSSGSQQSDDAAVRAAMELASLRHPRDMAGRTLLFRASFDEAHRLD